MKGAPDEVLKYIQPHERWTVSDLYERMPHRSRTAVKAYVRKLLDLGVIRQAGTSPTRLHPQRAAYVLVPNAPEIRTKQRQILDAIRPDEVVNTTIIRGRFPDWTAAVISTALREACAQGLLVACGEVNDRRFGGSQRLYRRPGASAATSAPHALSAGEPDVPMTLRPGEVLPFVALFTPPLPKFKIRATRVLRPLSSPVEDAA